MPAGGNASLGRRLRDGMRAQRFLVSVLIFALGILMITLAIGDFIGPVAATPVFQPIDRVTDQSTNNSGGVNYNLAFAIAGPIVFIIGAYFTGAYMIARRKFEHLMETKSKAEFLRNIPDLEQILWDLTQKDEQRYLDKRAELKIRR